MQKDGDYGQAWLKDNEAGSGPFKKGRWQHGVLYEMVAVADYWKGWPSAKHPDSVVFKLIRETNSLKIGLQKGQLDIALALSADDYDLLEKYKDVYVTSDPGVTTLGLKMNTQKGYTKDINIRKAINYAIDYEAMLKTVNGKGGPGRQPLPHRHQGAHHHPGLPPGPGQGQGVHEKGGAS
jgi:peptide/nickel transport system substrate-binding protein